MLETKARCLWGSKTSQDGDLRRYGTITPVCVTVSRTVLAQFSFTCSRCDSPNSCCFACARASAKDVEILVLRHQVGHVWPRPADRAFQAALSRLLPRARWLVFFVTPITQLRWHRDAIHRKWTYPYSRANQPGPDKAEPEPACRGPIP